MLLQKGEITELEIQAAAYEGVSLSRLDELVVFVRGGVPGDRVRARVVKRKRRHAEAVVEEVLQPSPERVQPACPHFGTCGGCTWQNASYQLQLRFKRAQVVELLERIAGLKDVPVNPTIGSDQPYHYRNKMEFTFGASRWLTAQELANADVHNRDFALGLHIPGRFDKILDLSVCCLPWPITSDILVEIRRIALEQKWEPYDVRKQEGYLRNLIVRTSDFTGEVMVNLVTSISYPDRVRLLRDFLLRKFPAVSTIINSVNSTRSPVAVGREEIVHGSGTITEKIGHIEFLVGPSTFFQPNSRQAERLYQVIRDFARLTGAETVLDLYCGSGGISLFLAREARRVIGVENQASAVELAGTNARNNGIGNTDFIAADAAATLRHFETSGLPRPDVVTVDPPRVGMHPDLVSGLLKLRPGRVVYVSCNPATQARDLQSLCQEYDIEQVQPVDMFPQTYHVENVVSLTERR